MKKFRSFSRRLTQRIVLALILTLILINAFIFLLVNRAMSIMIDNAFCRLLDMESQEVTMVLNAVEVAARNCIDEIEESMDTPEGVSDALADELRMNPKIVGFFAAFEPDYFPQQGRWFEPYAVWRGGMIEKLQLGSESHDYLKNEWYQKGLKAKKDYWSEPYIDDNGIGEMLCSYVRPLFDKDGRRVGVFGADLSLEWLYKKLQKIDENTNNSRIGLTKEQAKKNGAFSFIIASDGTYISHNDKNRILKKNFYDDVELTTDTSDDLLARQMADGETGFGKATFNGKSAYLFYTPLKNTKWTMGFVVPTVTLKWHSYFFGGLTLAAMLFGLLVVYWVCRVSIRHSTKPIHFLAESANEVAKGNFNAPLPQLRHNDEIYVLRESFSHMQQSLSLYIEKLKTTTAEKASYESELSIANEIQMSMLPHKFPDHDDVSVYGTLKPAKAVGGDLYDFFFRDGKLFFCIGDVLGKGVSAALLMTVTRSLFRAYSANDDQPEIIVGRINKSMSENNDVNMFVTLFVGVLDLSSGQLLYCSAGHEPPVFISHEVVQMPPVPALPVGCFNDTIYQVQKVMIEPGTTLFLFTDGLNEAANANGQMFEKDRVYDVARQAIADGRVSPRTLIDQMREAVEVFVGGAEQSDDLTMLAIQRLEKNTICLKASPEEYPRMTEFVKSIVKKARLDSYEGGRLRLAVEETVGNIIDYSGATKIEIIPSVSDGRLQVIIRDDGQPFDPTMTTAPDVEVPVEERQVGGLGIFYMRQMSDGLTYRREGGQNVLVIEKILG